MPASPRLDQGQFIQDARGLIEQWDQRERSSAAPSSVEEVMSFYAMWGGRGRLLLGQLVAAYDATTCPCGAPLTAAHRNWCARAALSAWGRERKDDWCSGQR